MHKPIAVHPIHGPVEGPATREQYVTRLAELIREETGTERPGECARCGSPIVADIS
jgi:hypothetical protein